MNFFALVEHKFAFGFYAVVKLVTGFNDFIVDAHAAALGETMSAGASSILTTVASSASNYKTIELACMVLSALPLIIIYPFAQKFFEKGVMVGSVKG